jgi:hypothetical protein
VAQRPRLHRTLINSADERPQHLPSASLPAYFRHRRHCLAFIVFGIRKVAPPLANSADGKVHGMLALLATQAASTASAG